MKCSASTGKGTFGFSFFVCMGDDGEQGKEQVSSDIGTVYGPAMGCL